MVNSADNLTAYAQYYTNFVEGYIRRHAHQHRVSSRPRTSPATTRTIRRACGTRPPTWLGRAVPGPGDEGRSASRSCWARSRTPATTTGPTSTSRSAVLADSTAKGFRHRRRRAVGRARQGQRRPDVRRPAHLGHRAQVRQLPVDTSAAARTRMPTTARRRRTTRRTARRAGATSATRSRRAGSPPTTPGTWSSTSRASASTPRVTGSRTRCWWRTAATSTRRPAYYVFRHLSQYVSPGANVVGHERRRRGRLQEPRRHAGGRDVQLRREHRRTSSRSAAELCSSPCRLTAGRPSSSPEREPSRDRGAGARRRDRG